MSNTKKEHSLISKALLAMKSKNIAEMKRAIHEVLLSKIRTKLNIKEKQMAKTILNKK
jgi:hypothetical protein